MYMGVSEFSTYTHFNAGCPREVEEWVENWVRYTTQVFQMLFTAVLGFSPPKCLCCISGCEISQIKIKSVPSSLSICLDSILWRQLYDALRPPSHCKSWENASRAAGSIRWENVGGYLASRTLRACFFWWNLLSKSGHQSPAIPRAWVFPLCRDMLSLKLPRHQVDIKSTPHS